MPTIEIKASRNYEVIVQRGVLAEAGERLKQITGVCTAAVISDSNVFALYGEAVCASLAQAGFRVVHFVFAPGEASKGFATYEQILCFLSENRLTRKDAVVALGGGIAGDMAGFAAATYQRGVAFAQIPTTLLAAVDSSVGGKTAINLSTGKNQVGSFYQPCLVLCDPETLATLPDREYRCGCAEVIKYAVLASRSFFHELSETPVREQAVHVITTCVGMKRDVVAEDEFDRGRRQFLNLGHTVGHAVEAASGFTVLHGQAVATGMAVITRAAAKLGYCSGETAETLIALLQKYALPTETEYGSETLYQAALSDKKMAGETLTLVVPREIGRCSLETIPAPELKKWMEAGGVHE